MDIQRANCGPARPILCAEAPPMSSKAGGSFSRRRDNSRGVCRADKRFEAATAGALRAVAQQLRTSGASESLTTLATAPAKTGGLQDFRLFARFDGDHPTLKLDPSAQRDLVNETLEAAQVRTGARISVVDRVASGLALTPIRGSKIEELEPHFARVAAALGATVVERNVHWWRWVVRGVPTTIDGKHVDEIIAQLRILDPELL
ncbi:hypothetical protein V8E36_004159 [Tilletia maclaganii]